ncbi:MAG: hypothetical protein K2N44_18605 [Lachnospiraceae bacterium]|nr:hypothetical protein [Lachnospiraceae bacterium]
MRIGNIDDLEKTGNSENLINIIQSEEYKKLSKSEKRKNWWYYYKWYVACGVILLGIACNIIGNALGLWRPSPDLQIAYVGEMTLPQDTVTALENAFVSIAGDFNGDGKVIVQFNQYANNNQSTDADAVYYGTASEITLIGDISDCESYFFLMDNPDSFQRAHQLLACPDGRCPDKTDQSTDDKVILWSDCSILSELDLGTYSIDILGQSITGSNQELLSKLYLGRRCFYTDTRTDNAEQCSALWDTLTNK